MGSAEPLRIRHLDTFGRAALEWLTTIEGLALAVFDPLAAVFGGNENDRGEVRRFLAELNACAAGA